MLKINKKKKILIRSSENKPINNPKEFDKIRNSIKSPSSKRIDRILVLKLSDLLRDFYSIIKRQSYDLIARLISKGSFSKSILFFFSKKIIENLQNKTTIYNLFVSNFSGLKFFSNQIRIYYNIKYLNSNFILFFKKKKKKNYLIKIFFSKKNKIYFSKEIFLI
jgi:hypothetical protein